MVELGDFGNFWLKNNAEGTNTAIKAGTNEPRRVTARIEAPP